MGPTSIIILHGGTGVELTLLEYVARVARYLVAFGGVAAIAFYGLAVVGAIRSAVVERRGENDP